MESKSIQKLNKGRVKNSEIEIEAEISSDILAEHKALVLADIKKDFSLPGFRKGMVPEAMILQNIKTDHLLQEAAESAIREVYPEIIAEAEIDPITSPQISITKLADGNPLGIKITVGLYPEISLPNYKKIAKNICGKREKPEVEEKEVEAVIAEFLKTRKPVAGEKDPKELTDEDVKQFGKFESAADFRVKLKENLRLEKDVDIVKRSHDKMVRDIVEESRVALPGLLVDEELRNFLADFEGRLKDSGETLDKYFERIKKTPQEVGKEQREYVEKSLKTKFVLSEILKIEKITANPEEAEAEAAIIKNYRPDFSKEQALACAESMILNKNLFALLEGEKEEKKQ
ncbi:MAG: trigger factor [Candidatus Liptonbacteria bacterium]|nr:trigger factor [Candidatus Liptonbacteria bacterium]